VWSGAGSGCSSYESKPSFQTDTGCARRTIADVSAVADPATGVAVYDSYGTGGGWRVYGGTSASRRAESASTSAKRRCALGSAKTTPWSVADVHTSLTEPSGVVEKKPW